MSAPPLVGYQDGMFQRDDSVAPSFFGEIAATKHHEAAHAVTMVAFGYGLSCLGVYENCNLAANTVAFGGLAKPRTRGNTDRVRVNYDYGRAHFVQGCITAAGPAGERRYRYEDNLPMRMLGATEGDHGAIDGRAKALEHRGRDRFAYRRLVWYAAQRIVARDDVWAAVEAVADLFDVVGETVEEAEGEVWTYIEPRDVYRACRQQGVTRGLLKVAA